MSSKDRSFRPALFTYLTDLDNNNDREWFAENRDRYDLYVRDAGLQFIRDFEPYLHEISPHFIADDRTVGGSLFRIYRDTRFSKDKTPYIQSIIMFGLTPALSSDCSQEVTLAES